jgi:hypothetical protein
MGSYDEVNFSIECPACKKEVNGFQTKDLRGFFETVEYWECDNFYSACDWCATWIEFKRKMPKPKVPIDHYEMTSEPSDHPEENFIRNKDGKISGFKGRA